MLIDVPWCGWGGEWSTSSQFMTGIVSSYDAASRKFVVAFRAADKTNSIGLTWDELLAYTSWAHDGAPPTTPRSVLLPPLGRLAELLSAGAIPRTNATHSHRELILAMKRTQKARAAKSEKEQRRVQQNRLFEARKAQVLHEVPDVGATDHQAVWDLQNLYYESSPCSITEPVERWEKKPDDAASVRAVEKMLRQLFYLDDARADELIGQFLGVAGNMNGKMGQYCPLRGCSSCGVREPRDDDLERVRIDKLPSCFELMPGSPLHRCRELLQQKVPLVKRGSSEPSPTDISTIMSIFESNGRLYHLHPELVDHEDDGAWAWLCHKCHAAVTTKKADEKQLLERAKALAAGYDFGCLHRCEPWGDKAEDQPSQAEQLLLAEVRHYAVVFKVSRVARTTLEGHMITFLQDSLQKAADGLEERISWLKGVMHVAFVGPQGDFDKLKHRLEKLPELRTRPRIIFNALQIRKAIAEAYNEAFGNRNLTPVPMVPDYNDCCKLVAGLGGDLLKAARVIGETATEHRHVQDSADQARVRDPPTEDAEPPTLAHVAVVSSQPPLGEATAARLASLNTTLSNTNGQQAGAVSAQRADEADDGSDEADDGSGEEHADKADDGSGEEHADEADDGSGEEHADESDKHGAAANKSDKPTLLRIARADDPQNEFADNGYTIMRMYPCLVPLMYLDKEYYKGREVTVSYPIKSKGALTDAEVRHMLLQYTNVFATCVTLIYYIANQRRRHHALRALNIRVEHDKFRDYETYAAAPDFPQNLKAAAENPKGPEARKLQRDLLPLLAISSRDVPWGKGERGAVISKLNGIERRQGPADFFITVAPNDKNNPTCIRLGIAARTNGSFPAVVEDGFFGALQRGEKTYLETDIGPTDLFRRTNANPVAAASFFDRLIRAVCSVLLKLPVANETRKTTPLSQREKGIIGTCTAHLGVKEVTGKKALHYHVVAWAAGLGSIISKLAAHPHLMDVMTETLNSLLCAHLPFEVYLLDEARRGLEIKPRRPGFYGPASKHELELDVANYQTHEHCHTCHKLPNGRWHCRECKPSPHPVKETRVRELHRRVPKAELARRREDALKEKRQKCTFCEEPGCLGECCDERFDHLRAGCKCPPGWFARNFGKHDIKLVDPRQPLCAPCDGGSDAGGEAPSTSCADVAPMEVTSSEPVPTSSEPPAVAEAAELDALLPKRDRRPLMCELERPIVRSVVDDHGTPSLLQTKLDAFSYATSDAAAHAAARELVSDALRHVRQETPELSACPEAIELCAALEAASDETKVLIVQRWRSIACRNGNLVEYSRVLSTCLQWNTAPYLIGIGEGARAAMYYLAKYVSKDSVSLSASLSVLVDVKNHCDCWPSRAEDSGTARRTALHFGQRVLNTVDMELADTQAASCALGHLADLSSEIFVWFDPWAVVTRARAIVGEKAPPKLASNESEQEDADQILGLEGSSDGSDVEVGRDMRHANEPDSQERASKRGSGRVYHVGDKSVVKTLVDHYINSEAVYKKGTAPGKGKAKRRTEPEKRTPILTNMSIYEYVLLISVEEKQTHKDRSNGGVRGARPTARFTFHEEYELASKYIQAAREKIPCPRVAGQMPPKPPPRKPGADASTAWLKAMREFAAFVVAVFIPWGYDEETGRRVPRELSIRSLLDWLKQLKYESRFEVEPLPTRDELELLDSEELAALQPAREREHRRRLARVRLADLENFLNCGRTDKEVKELCSAARSRNRKVWNLEELADWEHNFAAFDKDAQREIDELRERAEARRVCPKRIKAAAERKEFLDNLEKDLISLPPPRGAVAAWHAKEASELGVLPHKTESDCDALVERLRGAGPERAAPTDADVATFGAEAELAAGRAEEEPLEFAKLKPSALRKLQREWRELHADDYKAGVAGTPFPPLNAEQREFGRRIFNELWSIHAALRQGLPRAHATAGLDLCHLLMGPAGTGKTELLSALERVLLRRRMGRIVFTSYLGVACTLLPGCATTLCSLLGIPRGAISREQRLAPITAKHEKRFLDYAGEADGVALVVIDECSFLTSPLMEHIDGRLQDHLLCRLPFGGRPLVLAGDFWQLPPVGGTTLSTSLVLGALDTQMLAALSIQRPSYGELGAFANGIHLLKRFRRFDLIAQMRAADDTAHAECNTQSRDTTVRQPVSERAIDALMPLSKQTLATDPTWRFVPMVVLSHMERDTVNMLQARAFAAHHGLLLIRWKLPLCGANALTLDGSEESELYVREAAGFWGYFVAGAPGILNDNLAVALKLANGTHVTFHSLTMPDECECLEELIDGLDERATELVLDMPPKSINVVPTSLKPEQRKALLRRGLAWQDADGEPVVPIVLAREPEAVAPTSGWAAAEGIPTKLMVRKHAATLAFALTDYKWQGKTVARLLISLRGRRFQPWLTLTSFYTMRTRTRAGADQRTVGFDKRNEDDRNRLRALRHPAALRIWNGAYDKDGRWSDARAAALAAAILASRQGTSRKRPQSPQPDEDHRDGYGGYVGDVDMHQDLDGDEPMD